MTDQQIRDRVDDWALRGIRSIKAKQASPRELRIIIDQAHRHGITVTAHLHNYAGRGTDVSVRDAILMGIDRVEHSFVDQHLILAGADGARDIGVRESGYVSLSITTSTSTVRTGFTAGR